MSDNKTAPLLADLIAVEEIARVAPELNPNNYDHDDVFCLNTAMCELYEVVRKYRPTANPRDQGLRSNTLDHVVRP